MGSNDSNRNIQRDRMLGVLIAARGGWVSLPEILALGIAQFGARILELRRVGFKIENRQETINGQRHSWYRLVASATSPTPAPPAPTPPAPAASLFPDLKGAHRDLG